MFDRDDPKYGKRFRIVPRTPGESLKITTRIRNRLALGDRQVRFTVHAVEMCDERNIDQKDVLHVLRNGRHMETREYEDKKGRFRENFEGSDPDGKQKIRVVLREEAKILIITVIDL